MNSVLHPFRNLNPLLYNFALFLIVCVCVGEGYSVPSFDFGLCHVICCGQGKESKCETSSNSMCFCISTHSFAFAVEACLGQPVGGRDHGAKLRQPSRGPRPVKETLRWRSCLAFLRLTMTMRVSSSEPNLRSAEVASLLIGPEPKQMFTICL